MQAQDLAHGQHQPAVASVHEITSIDALASLQGEWASLIDADGKSTPYVTPDFLLPWIASDLGRTRCRAFVARREGRMIGLAPFVERRVGPRILGASILGFPTRGHAPPFDLIAVPPHTDVAVAFLNHIMSRRSWDFLHLRNLPADSPMLTALVAHASDLGCSVNLEPGRSAYVIDLDAPFEDYLAAKSANLRRNLKRARRSAEAAGGISFLDFPGNIPLKEAKVMFSGCLMRSWKSRMYRSSDLLTFHEIIDRIVRTKSLQMKFLIHQGTAVGMLLELRHRDVLYGYVSAHDVTTSVLSPGQLLLEHAVQDALRSGVRKYDLGGNVPYLAQWGSRLEQTVDLKVSRPGVLPTLKASIYAYLSRKRGERRLQAERRMRDAQRATVAGQKRSSSWMDFKRSRQDRSEADLGR